MHFSLKIQVFVNTIFFPFFYASKTNHQMWREHVAALHAC